MECNDIDVVLSGCSHGPDLLQVQLNTFGLTAGKPLNCHLLSCFGNMAFKNHTIAASPNLLLQRVQLLHLSEALEPGGSPEDEENSSSWIN